MKKACRNSMLLVLLIAGGVFSIAPSLADETAKNFVSVEQNLREMDKDKDGMVSVHEVRAALEARHGNGYEQSLLADMEASADGRSCSTPFAQNFY